jgi:glycosyltransferase involved in cell wall biosynthesis
LHVLRHLDREEIQMDFCVQYAEPYDYDEEVISLGSKVLPCLDPYKPWRFGPAFGRLLAEHGPYDIVHCHLHHYSGFPLWLSHRSGVPIRVAHTHNDTSARQAQASLARRGYYRTTEYLVNKYATHGLACSGLAAASLYGPAWKEDGRFAVLNYGSDLSGFQVPADRKAARDEFGIPHDAFVVGHVGVFKHQKNHQFVIQVGAELIRRDPSIHLLLVGEGELRPQIEAWVAETGVGDQIHLAGLRGDVPRLMRDAMDVFFFPSHHEGLGLVMVEAQAAGLPCIYSDTVPEEADVIGSLLHRISLDQDAAHWADRILAQRHVAGQISPEEAFALVEDSDFNIINASKNLANLYRTWHAEAQGHSPNAAHAEAHRLSS